MKGIEFAVLRNGVGATEFLPGAVGAWYTCVLVKHPTVGYFLYDVGMGPADDTFRRPEHHIRQCPLAIPRDEYIDQALGKLGLGVEDISAIVISHCHWDHIGGLSFFKGTEALKHVYVCRQDFQYGLVQSHRTAKGYVDPCDFYYRWNFDVEGAEFTLLEEDTELFPGVELKILQGHTPGVMAMVLHAEDGVYLFPSDTVHDREVYADPVNKVHCTTVDVPAFHRSVKVLKDLEERYRATVIFPHDDGACGPYQPCFRGAMDR